MDDRAMNISKQIFSCWKYLTASPALDQALRRVERAAEDIRTHPMPEVALSKKEMLNGSDVGHHKVSRSH